MLMKDADRIEKEMKAAPMVRGGVLEGLYEGVYEGV